MILSWPNVFIDKNSEAETCTYHPPSNFKIKLNKLLFLSLKTLSGVWYTEMCPLSAYGTWKVITPHSIWYLESEGAVNSWNKSHATVPLMTTWITNLHRQWPSPKSTASTCSTLQYIYCTYIHDWLRRGGVFHMTGQIMVGLHDVCVCVVACVMPAWLCLSHAQSHRPTGLGRLSLRSKHF